MLAAISIELGGQYQEDDSWDTPNKLKVLRRDTLWVREILSL